MKGSDIKARRIELGLNQLETAIAVGVAYPTYRLWEKGGSGIKPENEKKLREVLRMKEDSDNAGEGIRN